MKANARKLMLGLSAAIAGGQLLFVVSPLLGDDKAAVPSSDTKLVWHDDRIDAVWQYSIPAPTIPDRHALLWIPPNSQRVRGIIIATQNMLEEPLFQRKAFRTACAENDLALLLIQSGHDRGDTDDKNPNHPKRSYLDIFLNPDYPKGNENAKSAGDDLQVLLDTFAKISGYPELKTAPLMPVGHSSAGSFVWHIAQWKPERFFALMPFKTGLKDDGPTGIPVFSVESEWFDYGNFTRNVSSTSGAIDHQMSIRRKQPEVQLGFFVDVGAGHCNVSDDSIPIFSLFLKKVVAARIPTEVSAGKPVVLKKLDLKSGWLIPVADLGKPGTKAVAYSEYTGDPKDCFWYIDQELAQAVQDHMATQLAKKPQQINFVKDDGTVPTSGGTFSFNPKMLDDAGTFELTAKYIDKLGDNDMYPAGTKFENSGQPIHYNVLSGAARQVGPNRFRIVPHVGPLTPQGNPWEPSFDAYVEGNDEFQPTVRPAHAWVSLINKNGTPQTITFPVIANHPADDTAPIPLHATASSGLPVIYIVDGGPVQIGDDGQSLILSSIPKRATYPIKVQVSAFQWGRADGNKVQSAPLVMREFSITRPASPK